MKFSLIDAYAFSIGIAAVLGAFRFRKINRAYYPFIYCTWLAFANEVLGYILIINHHSNAININIYALAEALLYTWQFRNWQLFVKQKLLFVLILTVLIVFWSGEAFTVKGINHTINYFRILYSLIIVLMSIVMLSRELVSERFNILKNPIFIICLTFIIYYTYTVIIGVFWLYGFGESAAFRRNMVWILIYINLFANLLYALSIAWMPKKLQFLLPF